MNTMNGTLIPVDTKNDMNISEAYRLVYPYKRISIETQKDLTEITERILPIKEEIENYSMFDSFDVILYSLRYLRDNASIDFTHLMFVDCMSYCGAASFYAASYEFKTVLGIEFNKQAYEKAEEIKETMFPNMMVNTSLNFEWGSFQDFFLYEADVVYLDCTQVGPDSMIDEGVLLHNLFFPLCKKLLSGSHLIIVTSIMTLHTKDCMKLGLFYECIAHKAVDLHNSNYTTEYKDRFPRHLWILRVYNHSHK